jgi:hypothetical protein
MNRHVLWAALAGLTLIAPAQAFRLDAHRALTERAIAIEGGPLAELRVYAAAIVRGNRGEDLNLAVKWTRYNHFYKPGVRLRTLWRKTSDRRVRQMWAEAVANARRGRLRAAYDRVGRVVHHIQDMASPPHVVPVNHGLTDGFEKFPMRELIAKARGDRSVALGDLAGARAHDRLARDTLRAVREGGFEIDGAFVSWRAFWRENGRRFGGYGEAGNHFGATTLRLSGEGTHRSAAVPTSVYRDFARARLEDALAYTRSFLRYAVQRLRAVHAKAHTR